MKEHVQYYSSQQIKNKTPIPFKDHPQFPVLADILSRKDTHHAVLYADFSSSMRTAFIEAFLHHIHHEAVPHYLHQADLIYLNIEHLMLTASEKTVIEQDFQALQNMMETREHYLLIALNHFDMLLPTQCLHQPLSALFNHPKCRFIVFTASDITHPIKPFDHAFSYLPIQTPLESDLMAILRQQRTELEHYHHVIIPDELLSLAYSLAERYLPSNHLLEKTLLLLDSSAARAGTLEQVDNSNAFKPVLTTTVLINVLSGWTQIPASHLQSNKFKLNEFIQAMQQRVFGEDAAITLIGHELQQAQARLQQKTGPFCGFIFAGPEHTGKKTTALSLVEQLFKQLNLLYFIQPPPPTLHSFAEIQAKRCSDHTHRKRYLPLKDILHQTPYAVFLFEHIEQASPQVLNGLHEILSTGYLHDASGNQYNFHQAIIILSTTLGKNRLAELAQSGLHEEDDDHIDLAQLVMSEQKHGNVAGHPSYSPQEIANEIMPEITAFLPASICQYLPVIPFLPLNQSAIEKIMRLKLNILGKQLDARYGVELSYAPEIIRYLASTDNALKQLYFSIEQAVLNQADNKNRPTQLFLQLNETGQVLRCDWLPMTALRQNAP